MTWTVHVFDSTDAIPPGWGGVYLLFIDRVLDYAGQSDDIHRRLTNEHHVFDPALHQRIAVVREGAYETRLALERYFNAKYNPANSYSGTEKQAARGKDPWHGLTPAERRARWRGPAFDEFDVWGTPAGAAVELTLNQAQPADNVFGVPSIIAFRPGDIRKDQ